MPQGLFQVQRPEHKRKAFPCPTAYDAEQAQGPIDGGQLVLGSVGLVRLGQAQCTEKLVLREEKSSRLLVFRGDLDLFELRAM
jgi:hypothetical protein